MRRAGLSSGLVLLFVLSTFAPMLSFPDDVAQEASESVVETVEESALPVFPTKAVLSPSVEFWTSQAEASPMVLTRNLLALHEWQIENDLLPFQEKGNLVQILPSSEGVEHRRVTMPGRLVPKLVGIDGVFAVYDDSSGPEPVGALPGGPTSVKSGLIHGANAAWDRGYNGSGVRVAVADSGIDFAHPDLNGTQAILDDPSSVYDGWGIMHDPVSLVRWQRDGLAYPGAGNSWWVETTAVDVDADNDSMLDVQGWNISGILNSTSGTYHFGKHSDSRLITQAGGDVNIIVVDTLLSGVYDTVYIDIDRDGEFGDESPVTKTNPTYGLDTNDDGLWDQSAGLLWWISDGVNGVPYGDVYAARNGYQNRIAGAGDLILLMLNDASEAGGNHGTLCASAVAAQGVVNNGKVLGMAPGAELIAVSNLYAGGSWLDAFRFISEGYDGNATTGHDQGQIGSFSFGNSAAHDDGADYWSLYLDWLTRVHSPATTYFVAIGNGGHGYGTTASPGGAHGVMSVGAFSSKGTTWGESASWSNRGPNSVSRLDPDIVAVGWSATGDTTLNEQTDANSATTTWAGTSLATPVAAGLAAIIYQAWYNNTGAWPDSQTFRDLVMSTADDRGYDPLVQGGGWMNASRAVATLDGDDGSLFVSPASWMTGENEGAHRDGNLNFMLPGQNQTMSLSLENSGSAPMNVTLTPAELMPVAGAHMVWNSTDTGNNTTWDGYDTRPDWAFPMHIEGDVNLSLPPEATLIRARAVMEGEGFDGDQNLQSENRIYLRIYNWTDSDGDGNWTSDFNNDSYVDSGEWTESSELAMITEHVYESGQIEVRVGNPHDWNSDGLIVALWRDEARPSFKDPLHIEFDWTAFGPANDSWINAPANVTIAPGASQLVNVTVSVPLDARGGLKQHGIRIHAESNNTTRDWTWPVITNVGFNGPFTLTPKAVDGNLSNQTLYDETWMQGAQRWGWRAESGDWKFLTLDWPSSMSGNGSILVDVDWPDNAYTDVDVHWMSESDHPFYMDDPAAYGPRTVTMETGSVGQHAGGGKYSYYTNGGGSREIIVADDSPGTKQMMLHSAMHGVNTNDNPLNISVGYITPLGAGLETSLEDWSQSSGIANHRIGASVDLDIASISAHGFTIPQYLSTQIAYQDDPADVQSSSYIREFTAGANQLIEVEIGCIQSGIDLDMYLYRDKNNNGILDWGNEQVGSSGNFNCDEKIAYGGGQADTYWVVVHGYDLRASNTTFWLRWSEIGGTELAIDGYTMLNQSQILSNYTNGSAALGGAIPTSVFDLNVSWLRPQSAGNWGGFIDITLGSGGLIRLPYSFILIDPPPEVTISEPHWTRTNQSIPLSLQAIDHGTGFNISDLSFDTDLQIPGVLPTNATFETAPPLGNGSMALWQHWNTNRFYSRGDHHVAANGSLTLEAESAMAQAGTGWTFSNSGMGFGGSGYMTSTDAGFDAGNTTNGSRLSWEVEFDSAGTYWIWVRMLQSGNDSNAIHVGLDGQIATAGGAGLATADLGWAWANSVENNTLNWRAYLNVPSPGRHSVDVWMKEDGVDFDRLQLTTSQNWIPPTNLTAPSPRFDDVTLRAAWLNWTLPADNQWHAYAAEALDLTNRLGNVSMMIEHDDLAPSLAIYDHADFERDPTQTVRIHTETEAELWVNGTALPLNASGASSPDLVLAPTYWGQDPRGNQWDLSTWRWHGLNNFSAVARDPAGNWNSINFSIVHDPWPPDNSGPNPQMVFDSITVPEWDNSTVPVTTDQAYNFNRGEFAVMRLFDGYETCLILESSTGAERFNECQVDADPPWAREVGTNHPLMERHVFDVDLGTWPDDVYTVRMQVTDWAGNIGTHQAEILIDRTAPDIQLHQPMHDQVLADHHMQVNWTVGELSRQVIEVDGENVWTSAGWHNGSEFVVIDLGRTGAHSVCMRAWDAAGIDGTVVANIAESCVDILLPEETYWPTLFAPWNATHVNTSTVFANLSLGPDQTYEWWHGQENGTMYAVTDGTVSIPVELNPGENNLIFHLEALERTFVFQLHVNLDQIPPDLRVSTPADTVHTYRDRTEVAGDCEPGLDVIVNVGGLVTTGSCSPAGSFYFWAELPTIEGEWNMWVRQTDLADNTALVGRTVFVDTTSPNALLKWNVTDCDRTPVSAVWGTPSPADCAVSVDVAILSEDVSAWELTLYEGEEERVFNAFNGGETALSTPPISGGPGTWTATLYIEDHAGNRQVLTIKQDLVAPEATTGERFSTIGSLENLAGISLLLITLFTMQVGRRRPDAENPWSEGDVEAIIEGDEMFEDGSEGAVEGDDEENPMESTPSNGD